MAFRMSFQSWKARRRCLTSRSSRLASAGRRSRLSSNVRHAISAFNSSRLYELRRKLCFGLGDVSLLAKLRGCSHCCLCIPRRIRFRRSFRIVVWPSARPRLGIWSICRCGASLDPCRTGDLRFRVSRISLARHLCNLPRFWRLAWLSQHPKRCACLTFRSS